MTMQILAINDAQAEVGDDPVFVVNLENGRIAEIPCGPRDAGYFSGDRIVVWVPALQRAVIAAKHSRRWCFYENFCVDAEVNSRVGLTPEQGRAYFHAYAHFARRRGLGARAKSVRIEPEDLAKLWHPALLQLRADAKAHGGQARLDSSVIESITANLPKPRQPEPELRKPEPEPPSKAKPSRAPKAPEIHEDP